MLEGSLSLFSLVSNFLFFWPCSQAENIQFKESCWKAILTVGHGLHDPWNSSTWSGPEKKLQSGDLDFESNYKTWTRHFSSVGLSVLFVSFRFNWGNLIYNIIITLYEYSIIFLLLYTLQCAYHQKFSFHLLWHPFGGVILPILVLHHTPSLVITTLLSLCVLVFVRFSLFIDSDLFVCCMFFIFHMWVKSNVVFLHVTYHNSLT